MVFLGFGEAFSQDAAFADSLNRELLKYERDKSGSAKLSLKDSVGVNILNGLALVNLRSDPEKALHYAGRGLALADKIKYPHGQFALNNAMAKIYESLADYPNALKYFKNSLNSAKGETPAAKASVYTSIGNMYGRLSEYPKALRYMLRGLELAKKSGDKYQIARVYNNIGVLNKFQKRLDEALKYFLQALRIMEHVGDKPAIGMMNHNIGDIHAAKGDFEKAASYHSKGVEFARQANDARVLSMALNGLGLANSSLGHYDEALDNFGVALKINESVGFREGVAKSHISMGRNYFMKGDMESALSSTQKGLSLASEDRIYNLQMNGFELLSKIYEEKKDFKRALDNERAFQDLQDSIFNMENEQAFSQLKVKYDFKTAQDSIQAIQAQKDIIAQAEITRHRNTKNFIFLIMGLAVLFLIILMWQRNKIAIVKRQKALETERNRISRDLHDNLGAQLSTVRMFISSLKNNNSLAFAQTVDNSIGMLDASIGELRGIMHEMHNPTLIEKGYLHATEELINRVNQLHSVRFNLSTHNMEERPGQELEHQLYRITQELVNNTLKYATAKNVSIDVLRRDKKLVLMYEDDGTGFDVATVRKGYGLNNIEARIKALGGKVEFDSMPGAGSRTMIEIPE